MTQRRKPARKANYRTVGETPDGIVVLAPKLRSTKFTEKQIRSAVLAVLGEPSSGKARAGAAPSYQVEAIERARELEAAPSSKGGRAEQAGEGRLGRWRES